MFHNRCVLHIRKVDNVNPRCRLALGAGFYVVFRFRARASALLWPEL